MYFKKRLGEKMKLTIKTFLALAFLTTSLGLLWAKQNGIDKIKHAGVLTVGVKEDVPGFGFLNPKTKAYEGLEIDIAKAIANRQLFPCFFGSAVSESGHKTHLPLLW